MDKPSNGRGRPTIEWVFAAVSGVLVLGLVAFLGYQALFGERGPANLVVSIERVERMDNGTMVTVAVANRGDKAAASVTVDAALSAAAGEVPAKQISFDYIAAHAIRRGAFLFPKAISAKDLDIAVGGYSEL